MSVLYNNGSDIIHNICIGCPTDVPLPLPPKEQIVGGIHKQIYIASGVLLLIIFIAVICKFTNCCKKCCKKKEAYFDRTYSEIEKDEDA